MFVPPVVFYFRCVVRVVAGFRSVDLSSTESAAQQPCVVGAEGVVEVVDFLLVQVQEVHEFDSVEEELVLSESSLQGDVVPEEIDRRGVVEEFFAPMGDANVSSLRKDVRASPDDDAPGGEFLQGPFVVVVPENEIDLCSRGSLQEFQKHADPLFVQIKTAGAPLEFHVVRQVTRVDDPRGGESAQKTSQMAVHGGGCVGDVEERALREWHLADEAEKTKKTLHVFGERCHGMSPSEGEGLRKTVGKRWRNAGLSAPPPVELPSLCHAGNIRPR